MTHSTPDALADICHQLEQRLLGKREQIELSLMCLIAGGHLLLEDLPGMGKTTLAHALADVLQLAYARVQFTSDLLPGDLLGLSVFDPKTADFRFHAGPIFSQLLLADEINRSPPKTQSALLEAMAEGQVSQDGVTRPLPKPFFVIATQNPQYQLGTFPLPESQLDRFLMRIRLGYPDQQVERRLLAGRHMATPDGDTYRRSPVGAEPDGAWALLERLQSSLPAIRVSEALLDYAQAFIQATRSGEWFSQGLSPRGAIAWLQAARACALLAGRDYVVPHDLQRVAQAVVAHRVQLAPTAGFTDARDAVSHILQQLDVHARNDSWRIG